MFSSWRFWVGFIVSVLLVLILAYQVDLDELSNNLREANYLYVAPAVILYFFAVYFRALRWRFLLSPMRSFPVMRLYPVVIIGYMANNLLPARLGEVVRSYYLAQRERFSATSALATVAVERVYDGVTLLAFVAVAAPLLLLLGEFDASGNTISQTTVIVLAILTVMAFIGSLVLLVLLATVPGFLNLVQRVIRMLPARLQGKAASLVYAFVTGLSILNSPRQHLALFILSIPVWFFEGSMYFLVAYSFNLDSYFGTVGTLALVTVLLTATSNLATSIPSAIGGIGPFEVVAQQTLVGLGVGASVATTYAGFLHLVTLWLPVNIVGLALLWKQNLSLRQLVKARESGSHAASQEAVSGYAAVTFPQEESL